MGASTATPSGKAGGEECWKRRGIQSDQCKATRKLLEGNEHLKVA